jgi:hypothetical protein
VKRGGCAGRLRRLGCDPEGRGGARYIARGGRRWAGGEEWSGVSPAVLTRERGAGRTAACAVACPGGRGAGGWGGRPLRVGPSARGAAMGAEVAFDRGARGGCWWCRGGDRASVLVGRAGDAPGARRGGAHARPGGARVAEDAVGWHGVGPMPDQRGARPLLLPGPFCWSFLCSLGRAGTRLALKTPWAGFFFGPMRASQNFFLFLRWRSEREKKKKSNVATHLTACACLLVCMRTFLFFPARFRCM